MISVLTVRISTVVVNIINLTTIPHDGLTTPIMGRAAPNGAMAGVAILQCVGCGKDMPDAKSRKKLGEDSKTANPAARLRVLSTWRDLAASSVLKEFSSSTSDACLRMCTSCYISYDNLAKLQQKINGNLLLAAEKLSGSSEAASCASTPPPFTLNINSHVTGGSPPVLVSTPL
jgi:ribosomal protein S26